MSASEDNRGNDGRFKKGRSGNPKGRPKKPTVRPVRSSFDVLLDRTLTITHGGQPVEVSAEIALQHQTYRKAIEGNPTARRTIMRMVADRDEWHRKNAPKAERKAIEQKTEPVDPENANAAMLLLGIATVDESRLEMRGHQPPLLLEPWAVQAALSRRRGGRVLTDREKSEIARSTRDSDTLRWPGGTRNE